MTRTIEIERRDRTIDIDVFAVEDTDSHRRVIRKCLKPNQKHGPLKFNIEFWGEGGEPFDDELIKRRLLNRSRKKPNVIVLDYAWSKDEAASFTARADLSYDQITNLPENECPGAIRLLKLLKEVEDFDTPVLVWTWYDYSGWNKYARELGATLSVRKDHDKLTVLPNTLKGIHKRHLQTQKVSTCISRLVGKSPAIEKLRNQIMDIATKSIDGNVLILGEPGTGKNLVADILGESLAVWGPYRRVTISNLAEENPEGELFGTRSGRHTDVRDTPGWFMNADGGVIFLDEIGELNLKLQAKVRRVVYEGKIEPVGANDAVDVNVRVLAATNQNIRQMIDENRFRRDLYERLARPYELYIPTLAERIEDLPELAEAILAEAATEQGRDFVRFAPSAVSCLTDLDWAGRQARDLRRLLDLSVLAHDDDNLVTPDVLRGAWEQMAIVDHYDNRSSIHPTKLPDKGMDLLAEYDKRCSDVDAWLLATWRAGLQKFAVDAGRTRKRKAREFFGVTDRKKQDRLDYLLKRSANDS